MSPRILFAVAALAMTADAVGYTFGAIGPIEAGLSPTEPYWRRRLRLNLLLANHGLYLAAAGAWLAVALFSTAPTASAVLATGAMLSSAYSVVTIVALTRRDAGHAIPRAVALASYVAGFALAALAPVPIATGITARPLAPLGVRVSPPGDARPPLRVTRVVHATALLEVDGVRVLTDPWWSTRRHYDAGEPRGLAPSDLGTLALITSGQDHYDHSDFGALAFVPRSVPVVVPRGTHQEAAARAAGFTRVTSLDAWQSANAGEVRVTAVPAREGVAPGDFDYEMAYVYEIRGRAALFVGHRLDPSVAAQIARWFPRLDLALVAINDLRVRPQGMKSLSMSPDAAASVVRASGARVAVPIHYRYHGSWLQDALLLSHEGTPGLFADALAHESPATVLEVLAPGQELRIE